MSPVNPWKPQPTSALSTGRGLDGLIHRSGLRAWAVTGGKDLRGGRSFRMKALRRQEKLSIASAPISSEFMIHLQAFRSRCERLVVA